jgi:hypothetical protein
MRIAIFLFSILLTVTSCKNLVPYTDSLRTQNGWSDNQVKRIQFYTSRDIILQRQVTTDETAIEGGKIKIRDGKKVEEIIIKRGTPGVVTSIPNATKLLVSFEKDDNYYLSFGVNPEQSTRFVLLASEWSNGIGKVTYDGKNFFTSPDGAYTSLLVDLRKIQNVELNQRVAKGRKIQ